MSTKHTNIKNQRMKKLFLTLLTVLATLTSCEKDEEVIPQNTSSCTCGTITDDEITNCYTLSVRNECSGNVKTFCFDQDVWFNNYVGNYFCISNVQPW